MQLFNNITIVKFTQEGRDPGWHFSVKATLNRYIIQIQVDYSPSSDMAL